MSPTWASKQGSGKTNLPSNTAMRGFGGPQAMAAMETILDRIARDRGIDAAEIRKRNFYGAERDATHYGQTVENNRLHVLYDRLVESSGYAARRNPWMRLTPGTSSSSGASHSPR